MRKSGMTLLDAVKRIDVEHYRHQKAGPAAVVRLYLVADDIGVNMKLEDVDETVIDKAVALWRASGNKNATINRKLSLLSKTLRTAHRRWRILERMPIIDKFKEAQVPIHLLTPAEESAVLNYMNGVHPDMSDIIMFLIDTGCRLSEMRKTGKASVDWINNIVNIYDGKTGFRAVPMTERVKGILHRLVIEEGQELPWASFSRERCRYLWDKSRPTMNKVGDKAFHLHCLRHTCATRLLKAGVSVPVVSRWLGHSTLDMTMRYLRLVPSDLQEACRLMQA